MHHQHSHITINANSPSWKLVVLLQFGKYHTPIASSLLFSILHMHAIFPVCCVTTLYFQNIPSLYPQRQSHSIVCFMHESIHNAIHLVHRHQESSPLSISIRSLWLHLYYIARLMSDLVHLFVSDTYKFSHKPKLPTLKIRQKSHHLFLPKDFTVQFCREY